MQPEESAALLALSTHASASLHMADVSERQGFTGIAAEQREHALNALANAEQLVRKHQA